MMSSPPHEFVPSLDISSRTVYVVKPSLPLHRDLVIDAALRFVDEHGVTALSIRKLAAELGVGAMTIYNHVASKAALLDGVCERVLAGLDLDADTPGAWDDRVRVYARAWRAAALAHPGAFQLILTRQLASAEALRPTDIALAPLLDAGLDTATSAHVLRAFVAFQTGCILRELGASPTFSGLTAGGVAARRAELTASGLPNVAAAAATLARCHHREEYEFGVELLVTGVRAIIAAANGGAVP